MRKLKYIMFSVITVITLFYFVVFADSTFSEDQKPNPKNPFEILQKQIYDLNWKLNLLSGQSCPEGEFMTGIDDDGKIICRGTDSSAEIVAFGMGLENHLARSYIKITPETLPQATFIMGCQKSDDSVGLVGTDPFDSEHANFRIVFGQQLLGVTMNALGVEIFSAGDTNSSAYVELINEATSEVLATSNVASTSSTGWIEFAFNSNIIINQSQILVNFVTTTDSRIYNCADIVEFIPH